MKLEIFTDRDFEGQYPDGMNAGYETRLYAARKANAKFNKWLAENAQRVYGWDAENSHGKLAWCDVKHPQYQWTHQALLIGIRKKVTDEPSQHWRVTHHDLVVAADRILKLEAQLREAYKEMDTAHAYLEGYDCHDICDPEVGAHAPECCMTRSFGEWLSRTRELLGESK